MNNEDEKLSSPRTLKRSTLWKIRGKSQWAQVNSGKTFSRDPLWIRFCSPEECENDPVRLGCAISKKYGNAVARNTFKRRVKEVIRKKVIANELTGGIILLVGVSRSSTKKATSENIDSVISAFISSLK